MSKLTLREVVNGMTTKERNAAIASLAFAKYVNRYGYTCDDIQRLADRIEEILRRITHKSHKQGYYASELATARLNRLFWICRHATKF